MAPARRVRTEETARPTPRWNGGGSRSAQPKTGDFTVVTFVGSRFGGWLRSAYTFPSAANAQAYANRLRDAETKAAMFRFTRRVVPA